VWRQVIQGARQIHGITSSFHAATVQLCLTLDPFAVRVTGWCSPASPKEEGCKGGQQAKNAVPIAIPSAAPAERVCDLELLDSVDTAE